MIQPKPTSSTLVALVIPKQRRYKWPRVSAIKFRHSFKNRKFGISMWAENEYNSGANTTGQNAHWSTISWRVINHVSYVFRVSPPGSHVYARGSLHSCP